MVTGTVTALERPRMLTACYHLGAKSRGISPGDDLREVHSTSRRFPETSGFAAATDRLVSLMLRVSASIKVKASAG